MIARERSVKEMPQIIDYVVWCKLKGLEPSHSGNIRKYLNQRNQ